jgi:hypothetical protein
LTAVAILAAGLGAIALPARGADVPVASASAEVGAHAAGKKSKCERRVYRRARVCRDGRYRPRLLWRPKRSGRARARRQRVPCVQQDYLSAAVKAKAELLFGGPVCVEREVFTGWRPSQLQGIWQVGLSRCAIMNASPGRGFGTLLSLGNASRFCSAEYEGDARGYRGWGYVLLG